jgi:hypothetical protein
MCSVFDFVLAITLGMLALLEYKADYKQGNAEGKEKHLKPHITIPASLGKCLVRYYLWAVNIVAIKKPPNTKASKDNASDYTIDADFSHRANLSRGKKGVN